MAGHRARCSARTARTSRSRSTTHAGRAVVVGAIDNLGKGAAGQAVQSANLDARPARETARPATARSSAMSVTAAAAASGPPASPPASRSPASRDVALVVNDGPSRAAAGVFTTNRVKAAPVLWSQQVLSGGRVRAVVLNSGGANACTGPLGFQDTHATAETARRRARRLAPARSRSARPA